MKKKNLSINPLRRVTLFIVDNKNYLIYQCCWDTFPHLTLNMLSELFWKNHVYLIQENSGILDAWELCKHFDVIHEISILASV